MAEQATAAIPSQKIYEDLEDVDPDVPHPFLIFFFASGLGLALRPPFIASA